MDRIFFIIPLILIILSVVEVDNRNFLHRKLSDEELNGYHSPFIPLIVCVILFFIMLFFTPNYSLKYDELQEKYDVLQDQYYEAIDKADNYDVLQQKYDDLLSSVSDSYEDALAVKAYFLDWPDSTYNLAKQGIKNIYDNLYPGDW